MWRPMTTAQALEAHNVVCFHRENVIRILLVHLVARCTATVLRTHQLMHRRSRHPDASVSRRQHVCSFAIRKVKRVRAVTEGVNAFN